MAGPERGDNPYLQHSDHHVIPIFLGPYLAPRKPMVKSSVSAVGDPLHAKSLDFRLCLPQLFVFGIQLTPIGIRTDSCEESGPSHWR